MKQLPTQFEDQSIRRVYDEDTGIWWFSVIDIVQVLTDQADGLTARKYWNKLKQRLAAEGSQLVTDCHQLNWPSAPGVNWRRARVPRWCRRRTSCRRGKRTSHRSAVPSPWRRSRGVGKSLHKPVRSGDLLSSSFRGNG